MCLAALFFCSSYICLGRCQGKRPCSRKLELSLPVFDGRNRRTLYSSTSTAAIAVALRLSTSPRQPIESMPSFLLGHMQSSPPGQMPPSGCDEHMCLNLFTHLHPSYSGTGNLCSATDSTDQTKVSRFRLTAQQVVWVSSLCCTARQGEASCHINHVNPHIVEEQHHMSDFTKAKLLASFRETFKNHLVN
jgi:hypothetical protein